MGCGQSSGPSQPAQKSGSSRPTCRPRLYEGSVAELQMAVNSDPGFGSGEEDNQDVALGLTRLGAGSSSSSVVALFDGHGPCGREVASLARSAVVGLLQTRLDGVLNGQPVAAGYGASFAALDTVACAETAAAESGTSATVIVHDLQSSTIHVANVGDSKAVCARVDAESGIIQHRQLTADHYPGVAEERERIIAAGGRVAATDDVQLGARLQLAIDAHAAAARDRAADAAVFPAPRR